MLHHEHRCDDASHAHLEQRLAVVGSELDRAITREHRLHEELRNSATALADARYRLVEATDELARLQHQRLHGR